METGSLPVSKVGESFTEGSRLIPKRAFMVVVEDDQVELAVKTIIKANQTDHPGDGKIFVLPVSESFRVRTGENAL
jgi:nitrogen regulatory protein PII 2